jgi:molybdopterin-guanine dinucleotide biosynthesis protein A
LYLSVEAPVPEFDRYKLDQVPDPRPGSNGPLGGLLSALQRAAGDGQEWLLLVPCDAPFLPRDLAARLLGQAEQEGADVVIVRHASRLQPTFSLWGRSALADIESAVMEAGMAGFMQFLTRRRHAVLDWHSTKVNPFFNINDPATLEQAAKIVATKSSNTQEK